MNDSHVQSTRTEMGDDVQLLSALQQELQSAVHAISRNSLTDLELSLWRQEMLFGRLKRNLAAIGASARHEPFRTLLRETLAQLKTESDKYQMVVLRCSRSAAVLHDLCRLYRGAAPAKQANMRSLSYEV